jgi:flagellar biosynthesis protein FlhF
MREMQYFTEQAVSHRDALEKIRAKYGDQAKILTHRSVRYGGLLGFFTREGVEITGYLTQDSGKKRVLDLEEEKKKVLSVMPAAKAQDTTLQQVLKEVQSLKEKLDTPPVAVRTDSHPTISRIEELLRNNDFTENYTRRMVEKLKKEFSLESLDDFDRVQDTVVDWIGESVKVYREKKKSGPTIFILVGPTGVGKTTTIAKLAALYGIGANRPKKVRILTIDNYRIAAKEQIETYGEIMGIPVACVETFADLKKYIALYQDVDMVFIDTIGKSPKDFVKLAEMKELLEAAAGSASIHLAVSATTKAMDIHDIMSQFEPFGYGSVIITKLDETTRVGNIISSLADRGKSVSFLTDGQRVPQDIELASVGRLLSRLQGFRIKTDHIEKKFGGKAEDLTA